MPSSAAARRNPTNHPWSPSKRVRDDQEMERLRGLRNSIKRAVAANLTRLRLDRGLGYEQLGRAVGVSASALDLIERRVTTPNETTLIKLADYYNVRVGDFYRKTE